MSIINGDIVFDRSGKPMIVKKKNSEDGTILVDNSIKVVQQKAPNGIKNGLTNASRTDLNEVLHEIKNDDKHREIDALYSKINELKGANADSRLVKYLEGELQYRIATSQYRPSNYAVDIFSVI